MCTIQPWVTISRGGAGCGDYVWRARSLWQVQSVVTVMGGCCDYVTRGYIQSVLTTSREGTVTMSREGVVTLSREGTYSPW